MRADGDEIIRAPRRADDLRGLVFLLGHNAAVVAEPNVGAPAFGAVVARGAIGIEADETGEAAGAAVHLVDDLLVVDALEELPSERHAGALAALAELVQEAVGDELQPLLDQLVVDAASALDLLGRLELRRESGLELAKAHVVQTGGIHVIARDASAGALAQFDC